MSEELLINISPMESRVAVLDNGVLGEIYIERHHKLGLVGNIYSKCIAFWLLLTSVFNGSCMRYDC